MGAEPDETRRTLLLGGALFCITASYTLVKTVRDASFLAELPVTLLPYVFMAVGVLTLVALQGMARVARGRSTWESLATCALAAALSLGLFGFVMRGPQRWTTVAFYLWVNVYGLILMSQFWAFASSISHPREARRTFGPIGVGGLVGGFFGGLLVSPLGSRWPLPVLLAIAAALLAIAAPLARIAVTGAARAMAEPAVEGEEPIPGPASRRYVRWLVLAALCMVMTTTLLDYQMKSELQRRITDRAALTAFLGAYYGAVSMVALAFQLFLTQRMVQRLGAAGAAAVTPIGLAMGTGAVMVAPGIVPVVATRLWENVMNLSLYKVVGELFYVPLPPGQRRRVRGFIEAAVERLGEGFAGLCILALGATLGAATHTLGAVVIGLLVLFGVAWMGIRRGYVRELGRNLRRMNLDPQRMTVSLNEAHLLREMRRLLASPYERVALQGFELLEENAPESLSDEIPALLEHPAPMVRIHALRWAGRHRAEGLLEAVAALMRDPSSEVQGEALVAYAALRRVGITSMLERLIEAPGEPLRLVAVATLAENAGPAEEERAFAILQDVLRRGSAAERTKVVEGLGRRRPASRLHDLLSPMLGDPDLDVRRAALRAAGSVGRRDQVPILLEALQRRDLRDAARAGLAGFGDRVAGTLGDYLADASVPMELRLQIPRVLGEIRTQEAVNALFRCRERSDVRLSYQLLKASNRIRAAGAAVGFPRALVTEDIEYDVRGHLWALVHYRSCPIGRPGSVERLLCIALNERMDQSLNRVFRRLGLIYPSADLFAAYRGIVSDDARRWANSVEYVENALAHDHRETVLPLVDSRGEERRLRLAETRYQLRFVSPERSLEEMIQGEDKWLRACALYVVGAQKLAEMAPLVRTHLADGDPRVRETAQFAMVALSGA